MAYLTLDGHTIPVANVSPDADVVDIGGRGRASDGSPRSGVRAKKLIWRVTTPPIGLYQAAAIQNICNLSTLPVSANGVLMDSTATDVVPANCARNGHWKMQGGTRTTLTLELWEV